MYKSILISVLVIVTANLVVGEEYQIHIEADTDWFMVCFNASMVEELPRVPVVLTNTQPIQELYIGHGRLICTSTATSFNDFEVDYSISALENELHISTMKGMYNTLSIEIYHDSTTLIASLENSQTGGWWNFEEFTVVLTGVDDNPNVIPSNSSLGQNFPNPFNPATTISYNVQMPAHTSIKIYNNLGQGIRSLVDGFVNPGDYEAIWDGKSDSGIPVAAGTYYYQLKVGDYASAKRMILLK